MASDDSFIGHQQMNFRPLKNQFSDDQRPFAKGHMGQ
jgi:hypothetical protein